MSFLQKINAQAKQIPEAQSVLRFSKCPSEELLYELGRQSVPCVYKSKLWSNVLDRLVDLLGDTVIQVRTGNYANPEHYATQEGRGYRTIDFQLYVQQLRQGNADGYLA